MFVTTKASELCAWDQVKHEDKVYTAIKISDSGVTLKDSWDYKNIIEISKNTVVDVWLSDRGDRRIHRERLDLND